MLLQDLRIIAGNKMYNLLNIIKLILSCNIMIVIQIPFYFQNDTKRPDHADPGPDQDKKVKKDVNKCSVLGVINKLRNANLTQI